MQPIANPARREGRLSGASLVLPDIKVLQSGSQQAFSLNPSSHLQPTDSILCLWKIQGLKWKVETICSPLCGGSEALSGGHWLPVVLFSGPLWEGSEAWSGGRWLSVVLFVEDLRPQVEGASINQRNNKSKYLMWNRSTVSCLSQDV